MIKRAEPPVVAARRELEEETSIVVANLLYLFEFGGLQKRHLVFYTQVPDGILVEPRNEIAQCQWFTFQEMEALRVTVPTKEIVQIAFRHQFVAITLPRSSDDTSPHA